MRYMLFVWALLALTSCGGDETRFVTNDPGCVVEKVPEGTRVTCGDDSVIIEDGENGDPGTPGEDGSDGVPGDDGKDGDDGIVSIIDPCGDDPGNQDEILIVTTDGDILAWYKDLGLVILEPGNYVTTDDQACNFTVGSDLSVSYDLTVEATRERPSGAFIVYSSSDFEEVSAPATMFIDDPGLRPGGLWAELTVGNLSFCYQARGHGNQSNANARTLDLKHSTTDMVGDCPANVGNPITVGSGVPVALSEGESVQLRLLNSGKKPSVGHVTTTVEAVIEVKE